MRILGIHDGHNATACILEDGKILACISEERLVREKNYLGYPKNAIRACLDVACMSIRDIDYIALASYSMVSREDFLKWHWPEIIRNPPKDRWKSKIQDILELTHTYSVYLKILGEKKQKEKKSKRIRQITEDLGILEERIVLIEHHLAHAAAAYFGSPWREEDDVLVLTCDGGGDKLCATVNIANDNEIKRIAATSEGASPGNLYSRATFLLGMKPWEHEHKVMGMAPYSPEYGVRKAYDILSGFLGVSSMDPLIFENLTSISSYGFYPLLRERLEGLRFDWICGGLQKVTEDLLIRWIKILSEKRGFIR